MILFSRLASLAFVFFAVPIFVQAAVLSVDPTDGQFGPGDTFVVTIRLDTAIDECINAATVELKYPTDWMKASAVSKGESFFTLWTEEPEIDLVRGVVRLEGGIPAGYCGRVQGDPGKTNVIAKIIFTIPGNMIGGKPTSGPEPLDLSFSPSTRVLLNDGFGTVAPLQTIAGAYVRELTSLGLKNEWLDIVRADTVPPELFDITLTSDPQTFQGKYFIIFSTIDKQSGVHHYEVTEDDPNQFGYVLGKKYEKALFSTVKSPYVLSDQSLKSRVVVKAVDNAGNFSEAVLAPQNGVQKPNNSPMNGLDWSNIWLYVVGGGFVMICVFVILIFIRKRSKTVEPIKQDFDSR